MPRRFTAEELAARRTALRTQRETRAKLNAARKLPNGSRVPMIEIAIELDTSQQNLQHYLAGTRLWPSTRGDFWKACEAATKAVRKRYERAKVLA